MTSYRTTMRQALEEMHQNLNESNLDLMRKAAGGAKQTLKMKDGRIGMDSFTASAIMQIYDKVNDKNRKTMENLLNDGKKADIVKLMKFAMSKVNASYEEFEEEFELDEAKYDLYHKDFSSAMQHSYKMAKKLYGITVDPKEIDDKVASGPRKPSEGKTNTYRLKGDKGAIQVQVYNKGGSKPFELNMYKEEVEIDEGAADDARRAMRSDPDMKQRAFSKDVSATDDDEKGASKNIMMQLRKAVSLRSYDVEFADGKKQKVNQKIAQAVQNKYNSMRRPADKEKFQAQIAKSYKDMLKTIKSGYGEQKESILEKIERKIKENKNG